MIFEMNDRLNDESVWMRLNYELLLLLRRERIATRLCVLGLIEHLFEAMRERYLVTLSDTIPFLTETLEDEDERVETIAKRIVQRVEQLTGESIADYLK